MTGRSRRSVLPGATAVVGGLAGCLSGSPSSSQSTTTGSSATASTARSSGASATTVASPTTTTSTPEPCYGSTPAVDVPVPEKPEELSRETARDLVVEFEKAYKHAHVSALYDLTSYDAWVVDRRTGVERIEGGFRVKVKIHSDYSSTGNESGMAVTASGGYQHRYRVTDRRFVREGTTLACWGT